MMQIGLIGIGAGVAAALLFASVSSGAWLAVLLFYLAPLPMMIAGLGWSHWAALIAALSGALALGAIFSSVFFVAFLAGAGMPAWWLSYLAMLARPASGGAGGGTGAPPVATLEWYPPGRLVLWAALLGALMVVAAVPTLGLSGEAFHAALSEKLTELFRAQTELAPDAPLTLPGVSDPKRLIEFLAEAIPPAAAVIATITNTVNFWLAARVVKFSGRLTRPWPVLADMRLPRSVPALLAVAVALSFVGGLLGLIAGVVGASLLMAFGFLGFAVLHAITQGLRARGFLLGSAYGAVLVFGWPILALCLLGLIDTIFDLRGRLARKRGRPV
jgi:hypothetical protein